MKVLRYYTTKRGRFVQHSIYYPEDEAPAELATLSINIDPFKVSKTESDNFYFSFNNRLSFPERLLELRHFLQVLESMYDIKP